MYENHELICSQFKYGWDTLSVLKRSWDILCDSWMYKNHELICSQFKYGWDTLSVLKKSLDILFDF